MDRGVVREGEATMAERTACNGAGEAPKPEFSQEKAFSAWPEEVAATSLEEKVAEEHEGEDVGGPFVIVNDGDSDGHSDYDSDLGKVPDKDSPSEGDNVPDSKAAPAAVSGGDHRAAVGEVSALSAAFGASSANGSDRVADQSEGGADVGNSEPSYDFFTEVAQQEAASEEHGGTAALASSGSDPAVTDANSKAHAVDSEVEGKKDTADESAATELMRHKVAGAELDGEDAAAESYGHDGALTFAKSSSVVMESEVTEEDSKEEQTAADVVEPVEQGTVGSSALVENGYLCTDIKADSLEATIEPESQEDAAVESLGHEDAQMPAKSDSNAIDSEVNGEDSKQEWSAANVVDVVEEGTDGACTLMANGHVCDGTRADSFVASTEPKSHANESKLGLNATKTIESTERDATCEYGKVTSQTNSHTYVALSVDSCIGSSVSDIHAIAMEGEEADQQKEGEPKNEAELLERPLEAYDRNYTASVEELIREEDDTGGHSNTEGNANASGESKAMAKQVEGKATCGILQLEENLAKDGVDSSCEDCMYGVLSSNVEVEYRVEKRINEAVHGIYEPEEPTENTSQVTLLDDVPEETIENTSQETVPVNVEDAVSIFILHSFKLSVEHKGTEVAVVNETAAETDLEADNVVEAKIAAHEVDEIEVKNEADLAPSLSQQNCDLGTETAEYEKIEAPGLGQANEIENDVEVEPKEEVERETVDVVPMEESTFHTEPTRYTDCVDSDSINHSCLITELESCGHVHTEESKSREISTTTVEQPICDASWENGTIVTDEAEITSETENGSQEKPSDAVVDQGEPVDLNVDGLVIGDDQVGSFTGYESPVYDTVGVISKKDESNEIIGGSIPRENQSKNCNSSTMSDECSTRTENEVLLPINDVDETCNDTCLENVNLSTKSSDKGETKCLEALKPSSIGIVVPAEHKDNRKYAPGELCGNHVEFIGPQRVYMVKVPRFASDDLWVKTQAAHVHLDQLTQERDAINRCKQKQKDVCDQYMEKLEAARREEREARVTHGDKKNDLNSLRSMIGKINQANSIVEIDELIAIKERTMQHETISLKAEKLLIKEINDLKAQRKQLSFTIGSKAEINEAFDQKNHIHERHKALKKDSDVLFTNLKSLEENTRKILKSFEDERIALRKLNEEYRVANNLRQKAYSKWSELKKEPFKKNQYFFTYRENRNTAEGFKMSGDIYKLQSYCKDQIERVMEMWNGDEDFRKLYVESNKISTLRRLGTLDGRKLGPDEDLPIIPSRIPIYTSPFTASSPDVPTLTSVAAPVFASPASVPDKMDSFPLLPSPQISKRAKSKASDSSKQNENNDVSAIEADDIKQTEKDRAHLMEEQLEFAREAEELACKEEELRKQRAIVEKEQLQVEQKAKAKEAEERKRRKAEKEKERAEFKAKKEAEEKEKKKAKKDKRKGPTPADSSATGDRSAAALASTDTNSKASNNPREVKVAQSTAPKRLSKPATAKQLNRVQPMPAPLRNRGKRRTQQYILIVVAVLSVLALFVAGNYVPRLKALHF